MGMQALEQATECDPLTSAAPLPEDFDTLVYEASAEIDANPNNFHSVRRTIEDGMPPDLLENEIIDAAKCVAVRHSLKPEQTLLLTIRLTDYRRNLSADERRLYESICRNIMGDDPPSAKNPKPNYKWCLARALARLPRKVRDFALANCLFVVVRGWSGLCSSDTVKVSDLGKRFVPPMGATNSDEFHIRLIFISHEQFRCRSDATIQGLWVHELAHAWISYCGGEGLAHEGKEQQVDLVMRKWGFEFEADSLRNEDRKGPHD